MGAESFKPKVEKLKVADEDAPSWTGWGNITKSKLAIGKEIFNLWTSREEQVLGYIDTALARKGFSFDLLISKNISEEESKPLFNELWAGIDSAEQRTEKIRVAIDKIIEFVAQYDSENMRQAA